MTFRVIRASSDYGVVIVVSPEDADPEDAQNPEYRYYEHNECKQELNDPVFQEVSWTCAIQYFGGIADGLGFGKFPKEPFNSLKELEEWMKEVQRQEKEKQEIETYGKVLTDEEKKDELRDLILIAPLRIVKYYLDKIEKEMLPNNENNAARNILLKLLKSEAIEKDSSLSDRVNALLKKCSETA